MKLNKLTFTAMAVAAIVAQPFYAVMASHTASATGGIVTHANPDGWDWGGAAWPAGTSGSATIEASAATGGNGVLHVTTPANESYIWAIKDVSNPLSGINSLSYMSQRVAGLAFAAPALVLYVDKDGDPATVDGFYTFFEPAYNYPTTSTDYDNWNTWNINAASSLFWSGAAVGTKGGANGANMYTLDYAKTVFPNATINEYYVNMGTGNTGWDARLDKVSVNGVLIADFELEEVVTNVTTGAVYEDLQSAVDAASASNELRINQDVTLTDDVDITKALTIDGNGHVVTANFVKTDNSNNSAFSVLANNVTIKNVTLDGVNPVANQLHGINAYAVQNLLVDTVTVKNFRTGILYNGSTGTIQNVQTANNIWHGINIDKAGANVSVLGTNTHTEAFNIYVDDDTAGVTVNAPAYEWSRSGLAGRDNDRVYRLKVVHTNTDDYTTTTAGGGGNGEVPATGTGIATNIATTVEGDVALVTTTNDDTTENAKDNEVLGSDEEKDALSAQDSKKQWSLLNVLLAATVAVMAIITLAGIRGAEGRAKLLRALTIIPAIAAIVTLLIVEDFGAKLALVNAWTLLFVAIAAVQAGLVFAAKKPSEE